MYIFVFITVIGNVSSFSDAIGEEDFGGKFKSKTKGRVTQEVAFFKTSILLSVFFTFENILLVTHRQNC